MPPSTEDSSFEIQFWENVLQRNRADPVILEALANLYTKVGRVDEGLKLDRKRAKIEPNNPVAHYNLACSLALKNKRAEAFKALRLALELGFDDFDWMWKDPDLKSLRSFRKFRELLEEFSN